MLSRSGRNRFRVLLLGLISLLPCDSAAQLSGVFRAGLNIGTINQEWWSYTDSIRYEKPLIRGVVGVGAEYSFGGKWVLRQEAMFQIKGQGTSVPNVRSFFLTQNPDILRFMSFPLSVRRRIVPGLYAGLGIEPSLYLSGSDNYYAKEPWHGWVWSVVVNASYQWKEKLEIGMDYDHDLILYYCPNCGIRFYTIRLYAAYLFRD